MDPIFVQARRQPRSAAVVMTAVLLVLLVGCADRPEAAEDGTAGESTATPGNSDDSKANTSTGQAGPGSELLAFNAETVGGEQLDGAELVGEPVALWFWAPW